MKRLMISGFAAIALLAAATTMLWSHAPSTKHLLATGDMTSPQAGTDVSKLPVQEFEDMSLVFSAAPKR
jgi:hypothetical protein